MTTDYLRHTIAVYTHPTDDALIVGCLKRVANTGRVYASKVEMYMHFREMLNAEGYSEGLDSQERGISCVTQFYQPIDMRGNAVKRYDIDRVLEDDLLIKVSSRGYTVTSSR